LAHELHTIPASTHPAPTDELDSTIVLEERTMWTKPDFTEMRFGFEITMYIGNR
jgi:coenzyme PQQ precursor peptide PqqA